MLLTEQVWHSYFDITRGVAPLLTAFVLLVAIDQSSPTLKPAIPGSIEPA
jgi:hypothetical protein